MVVFLELGDKGAQRLFSKAKQREKKITTKDLDLETSRPPPVLQLEHDLDASVLDYRVHGIRVRECDRGIKLRSIV